MKTRDKIIQASIELFNELGERNVTTNHIAAHLGISPGNLYYHFRNKEDIILSIYSEYSKLALGSFPPITPSMKPLDAIINNMDSAFQLMSRFRFFYSNLPVLLRKSPELHSKYVEVQNAMSVKISDMLMSLRDAEIVEFEDDELSDLSSIMRFVTTFWLSFFQTQTVNATIDASAFYEGLLKVFAVLKPYVTPSAMESFKQAHAIYLERYQQSKSA